jgi:4-amino-4-deoxy-L-arabinose transferase-like glycosyltransferase
MKGKHHHATKNTAAKVDAVKPGHFPKSPSTPHLERWLGAHHKQVIVVLILCWVLIRLAMFNTIAHGPVYEMYRWPESDNHFFDEWARKLANGDWLNRQSIHPYHSWHREFADYYFKQHPEKLLEIQKANPNRDSTFIPGKVLWNEWYGGNIYHQEPLYAYVLAVLYTLTGKGVYFMMLLQALLGVFSGILLWRITKRNFGDTVALITGILYLFCGIVLFQEALILRTSWIIFFVLATIYGFEKALDKRTTSSFFWSGLCIGLAFLMQATFILYLLGALIIYWRQERKNPIIFARNGSMVLAGFFLVYALVMLRNATVGAPVFSVSSVGAVTFVAANVHDTKTVETWMPDASKCAEIMGKTKGAFGAATLLTMGTHPTVGSYLQLVGSKFQQTVNGVEWPNNESYYFYKQLVPALNFAFLNFFWFNWLGVAGMLFSVYYRKKLGTMYVAIAVQLVVLLGFYVLGRFRCPLAVLLLPFSAFALVECCRFSQKKLLESAIKLAVALICFLLLSYAFYRPGYKGLDRTDYTAFYELNYYERVKNNAESGQYVQAIAVHTQFLNCQPDWVRNVKHIQVRYSPLDIDILNFFADHYQIHGYLYEDSGNKQMAVDWMARSMALKRIAENARERLKMER